MPLPGRSRASGFGATAARILVEDSLQVPITQNQLANSHVASFRNTQQIASNSANYQLQDEEVKSRVEAGPGGNPYLQSTFDEAGTNNSIGGIPASRGAEDEPQIRGDPAIIR